MVVRLCASVAIEMERGIRGIRRRAHAGMVKVIAICFASLGTAMASEYAVCGKGRASGLVLDGSSLSESASFQCIVRIGRRTTFIQCSVATKGPAGVVNGVFAVLVDVVCLLLESASFAFRRRGKEDHGAGCCHQNPTYVGVLEWLVSLLLSVRTIECLCH